jgi:hypothetical protein
VRRLVCRPDGRCFLHSCQASVQGPGAYNAAARQNGVPVDDVLKDRLAPVTVTLCRSHLSLSHPVARTCHSHTLSLAPVTLTFTLTL